MLPLRTLLVALILSTAACADAQETCWSSADATDDSLGTTYRPVTVSPPGEYGGSCGAGRWVGLVDTGRSYGTPADIPHVWTLTRHFDLTAEQAASSDVVIRYMADDAVSIRLNGSGIAGCTAGMSGGGECFFGGCMESAVDPAVLRAGTNTLTVQVTDAEWGWTAVNYEICIRPRPATATPTPTRTPIPREGAWRCLHSGDGGDPAEVRVDLPMPPCGNGEWVSHAADGLVPPGLAGTFTLTYHRNLFIPSGTLSDIKFWMTDTGDDAVTMLVNGLPVESCGGVGLPACYDGGCRVREGGNAAFAGAFREGDNDITVVVRDVHGLAIAAAWELCAWVPVRSPGADSFEVSRNVFRPGVDSPDVFARVVLRSKGRYHLNVYNSAGELVRVLRKGQSAGPVREDVPWDGRNGKGEAVASGVYVFHLESRFTAANRKIILVR
jgi:hypothetical protein